jgi:cytochrome d ubiquinol oxidase subunit I
LNYPFWDVPGLGGGLLLGLISIFHVFNSHFAVGGGAFLAVTEQMAYKNNDDRLYGYLKQHSLFFLLVTTVLGVVTGPGIWWSISLVSPSATATLITQYSLLWGFEYVVFLVELLTFFVYYYTWNRMPKKRHLQLAWAYFFISILTLVTINGMLTFMLTPGNWIQTRHWADGYFNPTYWPSNFLRLLIMFGIAGMFALVTSSRIKDLDFRTYMLRYSAKWLLPVFFLAPLVGFWYFLNIPPQVIETIQTGIQNSGTGNFSVLARALYLSLILSGTVLIFAWVGPYLNPKGFSFKASLLFLVCGLLVTGITEWTREMLRKPYVIYGYMYSNSLPKASVPAVNRQGYFNSALWARASLPDNAGTWQRGHVLFRFQCQSCHVQHGYRSMDKLLGGRDYDAIVSLLTLLRTADDPKNPYHGIMPPLVGSNRELNDLAWYLHTYNQANMPEPPLEQPGQPSPARPTRPIGAGA